MIWALIVTVVGAYTALWGWIAWRNRRRDAQKGKLRLLVEENDLPVWRIVKGQCLVGFTKWKNFEVTAGYRRAPDWEEWVIIRSFKGKWIAYRPKGYRGAGQHRIGTLEIFDSLAELEQAVPREIFEQALKAAKLRPPEKYPEAPLDGMSDEQPDNRDERQKRLDERLAALYLEIQALSRDLRDEQREQMDEADRLERWRVRGLLKAFDEYVGPRRGPQEEPPAEP